MAQFKEILIEGMNAVKHYREHNKPETCKFCYKTSENIKKGEQVG